MKRDFSADEYFKIMKKLIIFFLILINAFLLPNCTKKHKTNLYTPNFIIDCHRHFPTNIRPDGWKSMSLPVYKKYNAMGCFFVPMKNLEIGIKFANANPDRVIPYAAIDIDSPTVLEDIQKSYDMGYKGLGELFAKNQWNYNDPKYDQVGHLLKN